MDKYKKQLEETVTFKQLLAVVNKYEKRKLIDYLPIFLPYILFAVLFYIAVILLIVFGIKKYIAALILIFTFVYILCGYGIYDKYFAFKIFKRARKKEIDALK